jgi:addiction module RelE/StbE family toxin
MLNISYHNTFRKQLNKLDGDKKEAVKLAIKRFQNNRADPSLYNHQLKGNRKGYRSISASFDLRIVFYHESEDSIILTEVGTHSQLYG